MRGVYKLPETELTELSEIKTVNTELPIAAVFAPLP
jgi:hypothetical protein